MGGTLRSVLVVDDDPDVVEVMGLSLEALGVERVVGLKSLAEVTSERMAVLACELAILDINLGTGDPSGLDVVIWLQAQGFRGRIVFLTGHAASDPRVIAASQVAEARVLSKPIDMALLAELLVSG